MFICPNCKVRLVKSRADVGVLWVCPSCGGRSMTVSLLRKKISRDTVNALWQVARAGEHPHKRRCPACDKAMVEIPVPGRSHIQYIDVCKTCLLIWFDPREYESLPGIQIKPLPEDSLSQDVREKLAIRQLEAIRKKALGSDWGGDMPDEGWKHIPALLGMPVEYEAGYFERLPWLTWLLALVVTTVSILAFFDLDNAVQEFGLIPAKFGRYYGLTFLTSFFLHGGIFHLLGNMYFLIVFGDNVEDFLGKWRLLALVLLATVVGDAAHIMADPASTIPCIGASGGISGVLAYYALKFPRARLGVLIGIYFRFRWIRMPAYAMFLIWIGIQVLGTHAQLAGFSNVSSLAHLGGASVGFVFWTITRNK